MLFGYGELVIEEAGMGEKVVSGNRGCGTGVSLFVVLLVIDTK